MIRNSTREYSKALPDFVPAKFEIHLCPEREIPICGNLVGGPEYLQFKQERDYSWKEQATGQVFSKPDGWEDSFEANTHHKIDKAKFYFPLLGTQFNRRWYAWNAKYFVYHPLPCETWSFLRTSRSSFSPWRVVAALNVKEILWEAEEDSLQHLMPLIILFQCRPAELKNLFGKGSWKKLAANTKSRNKLICLFASKNGRQDKSGLVEKIRFLAAVESSVIQHFIKNWDFDKDLISAARQSENYAPQSIEEHLKLYRETADLLHYELQRCNPTWSSKRLLQEHDKAIKAQRVKRLLQSEGEEIIFCEPFHYHSRSNHYSAERLQSEKQITKEAFDQHHCGSLYGDQAKAGSYAVFKITGKERGTLGVNIIRNSHGPFDCEIDQIKLIYNNAASNMTVDFCKEVVENFTKFINQ